MTFTPLSGTLDLVDDAAEMSEFIVETFRSQFHRFGYSPIAPPILERATAFLERSGEDIRRRMYIFVDPGGEEVCLRPELTIPAVRLYANRIQGRGGVFRCYYVGPVFRYDSPREGRYRQFTQAGVELVGDGSGPAADAEVLALADRSLRACGVDRMEVLVSDVGLFNALFEDSRVSVAWRAKLTRLAGDPAALLAEVTNGGGATDPTGGVDGKPLGQSVGAALQAIEPDQRATVVAAIMEVLGVDHLGARSPQEIAVRLLSSASIDPSEPLDSGVAQALLALLQIDEAAPAAVRHLEEVAGLTDSESFGDSVACWKERLVLLDAYGLPAGRVRMRLQMRRSIDYYSGFVFEIHSEGGSPVSQLCAGGRYDDLVRTIGGREGAPAVGFAAGVERIGLTLSAVKATGRMREVEVVVVSGGDVAESACVRVATALRDAGLDTEIVTGHRTRHALRSALRRGIRYLVVVGEEELARDEVVIRDLDREKQETVALSELPAVASTLSRVRP